MKASNDFNWVVTVIVIVVVVLGPIVERWRRRQSEKRGEAAPPGPAPEDPKLPYEDLVDQVFGPYMERRRKEHEARQKAAEEVVREPEGVEAPPTVARPEPPRRIPPRRAAPPPAVAPVAAARPVPAVPIEEMKVAPLSKVQAASAVTAAAQRPLEERLFGGRRLSPAAKLVLSSEILQRPKFLRRGAR